MSERKDAIVVGGSVGGLVAATYLARAGRRVLLLDAQGTFGGSCQPAMSFPGAHAALSGDALCALDPRLVRDLRLRGLTFGARDMPLVALCEDGRHVYLGRDVHAASRAIAACSPRDADAYRRLHKDIFALGRAMRPFWWDGSERPSLRKAEQRRLLSCLSVTSALAFLSEFESDVLKANLAFGAGNASQSGSSLALAWRAAQEMCGFQGAVAMPRGGVAALIEALTVAASDSGVELRTRARAERLILNGNSVTGVALESGEEIPSHCVLSALSRRETLLGLAPTASAGFAETQKMSRQDACAGEASILLLLNAAPQFAGPDVRQTARFVIANRTDSYAAAVAAARNGHLPDDPLFEVTVPTACDSTLAPAGQHLVFVRVVGLPLTPRDGWPALTGKLIERVVSTLERHTPHLRERIVGTDTRMPKDEEPETGARLMASYATRINTPISGLFLCGTSAEPMNAISGRAGRVAAGIANAWLARENHA